METRTIRITDDQRIVVDGQGDVGAVDPTSPGWEDLVDSALEGAGWLRITHWQDMAATITPLEGSIAHLWTGLLLADRLEGSHLARETLIEELAGQASRT
jgi:hypothetical protein